VCVFNDVLFGFAHVNFIPLSYFIYLSKKGFDYIKVKDMSVENVSVDKTSRRQDLFPGK
jgi:hypothetical protein